MEIPLRPRPTTCAIAATGRTCRRPTVAREGQSRRSFPSTSKSSIAFVRTPSGSLCSTRWRSARQTNSRNDAHGCGIAGHASKPLPTGQTRKKVITSFIRSSSTSCNCIVSRWPICRRSNSTASPTTISTSKSASNSSIWYVLFRSWSRRLYVRAHSDRWTGPTLY